MNTGRIIIYHHKTDPNPPSEKNVHRQLHLTEHLPFPDGGYFWLLNDDFARNWNPRQISRDEAINLLRSRSTVQSTTPDTTNAELDRLADAFVEQDRTTVKLDAAEFGIESTAESLRSMAAEQGGHWSALDSDEGEQALADAIRALRC